MHRFNQPRNVLRFLNKLYLIIVNLTKFSLKLITLSLTILHHTSSHLVFFLLHRCLSTQVKNLLFQVSLAINADQLMAYRGLTNTHLREWVPCLQIFLSIRFLTYKFRLKLAQQGLL